MVVLAEGTDVASERSDAGMDAVMRKPSTAVGDDVAGRKPGVDRSWRWKLDEGRILGSSLPSAVVWKVTLLAIAQVAP